MLKANANQSFIGSYVLGMGFTMSEKEAKAFIAKDPKNAEVLFPYLNGEDLNSSPEQKASRWVINFFDWPLDRDAEGSWEHSDEKKRKAFLSNGHVPADYPSRVAMDFPELLAIVKEKVKPERDKLNTANSTGKKRKENWWRFGGDSKGLYHAIGCGAAFALHPQEDQEVNDQGHNVIAVTRVSKTLAFAYINKNIVFADATVIIATSDIGKWAILQSAFHSVFAWQHASKMKSDLRYSPSDAFETFPFPIFSKEKWNVFCGRANCYQLLRHQIMVNSEIGLTQFYKSFHNQNNNEEQFEEARSIQREIDIAVRDAYGWNDIDLEHGFHAVSYLPENDNIRYTISEAARIEILKRLAKLNRERWEGEQ